MPLLPRATGYDLFSRSATDSWGTSDSGHAWLGETSIHDSFYTAGVSGYGRIAVSSSDSLNRVVYLDVNNSADQEVLVKFKWSTDNTTDNGPVLRYQNTSNYFYVAIIDSSHQIKLGVRKNDTRTILATASKTVSKDTYYWVRAQITGTTFHARIWAEGVVEPGTWDVTYTISSTTGPSTGKPGFRTQSEGTTHYVYVDTFYAWNESLSDMALPVTDTFSRNVHTGAGWSDSGHRWKGHVSDDPYLYQTTKMGYVTSTNGYLTLSVDNVATDPRGMIGPDSTDVEVYAKVYCSAAANSPFIRVGARASDGTASGSFDYGSGEVYVRLQYGSTTVSLFRDTTSLASIVLAAAPAAGEIWHIRFQAQGTTARARVWKDGSSEPGTYALEATSIASIASSGQAWWRVSYASATPATMRFYDFTVTQITNTTSLTTGSITATNITDTTFDLSTTYTFDTDDDSSVTLQYKKQSEGTWTTASSPSVNRGTKTFSKSITGLTPGTVYDIRATFSDPDGINGANPVSSTATTTLKGTDVAGIELDTTTTLGEIYVEAHYTNDSDSDNSAVADYRELSGFSEKLDYFVDVDGTLLDNHGAGTGDPDVVVPAITYWANQKTTSLECFISEDGFVYPEGSSRHIYNYIEEEPADPSYYVDVTIELKTLEGSAGVISRSSGTDYYYAYYTTDNDGEWHFGKCIAGVDTDFYSESSVLLNVGDTRVLRLVTNGNQQTFYMGATESTLEYIYTQTDASITNANVGGIFFGPKAATLKDGVVITRFKETILGTVGAWSSTTSLTTQVNASPTKYRSVTLTGLSDDTYYEVRVTFSDADGVRNLNPISGVIKTPGSGVQFATNAIDVTAYDTTAIISAYYIFDTDSDSKIDVQYRSIRDRLWTTLNRQAISVNRGSKVFRATLNHLVPNISYQVTVTISDPEGVIGDNQVTETFVTTGAVIDPDRRGKHYLHKVYGLDGEFLGTWRDAPEPKFRWNENGGLSDLSVELPRKMSSVNNDPTMDFGHRVDVWAFDTSGMGMGVNLMTDDDMDLGSWTLATSWSVDATGGPDNGSALKFSSASTTTRTVLSETIDLPYIAPLVVQWVGRAVGGKLRLDVAAYDASDVLLGASDDNSETIGSQWQTLSLEFLPPHGTSYVRVRVENVGAGTMWFDKVSVLQREMLIYRGYIESYTPKVDKNGESVTVEVLSLAAQLSDYVVQFLQFVDIQPSRDVDEYPNQNLAPDDPSNMMKKIIDMMIADNPRCDLYYTGDSINLTGTIAEYTFREQHAEDCFDDIRNLCPSGWHWFIDPDGLVHLRGEEHSETHQLRLNVEIMEYENKRTIEDMKNKVIVRGRRDEDTSEPDGLGSIEYIAFDQDSIDRYGLRVAIVRDANIKDNDTAELVGNGRLEEWNRVEEEGNARIPDEKDIRYVGGALGGYNIEAFRPGDRLEILDPVGNDGRTFWDQFLWDDGAWDDNFNRTLPQDNPIKTIRYSGHEVSLDLSNRQPSSTSEHSKFLRWLREQESKTNN